MANKEVLVPTNNEELLKWLDARAIKHYSWDHLSFDHKSFFFDAMRDLGIDVKERLYEIARDS